MMGGTLGKAHLWLTFVGFHLTFLVQHWLGAKGRPRRYADYLPTDGFTTLNMNPRSGRCARGLHGAVHLERIPQRNGRVVAVDDPWDFRDSLKLGHELPTDPAITPWPSPGICNTSTCARARSYPNRAHDVRVPIRTPCIARPKTTKGPMAAVI
jgi:heme/copper-type cytochrome/quinol oxidase subunit 1